jgi:molybdopterin molybdotransferase
MTTHVAETTPLLALDAALDTLLGRLEPVGVERVELSHAAGRILAEDVRADRPSPPVDVSAMDGVAIHLCDAHTLASDGLSIAGEASIGAPVCSLPVGTAMRIFTGGPVPTGADVVVMRESLIEADTIVRLRESADRIRLHQHIRFAGENAICGDMIARAGSRITPAVIGALASVGAGSPLVQKRVRVAIIVTGDELVSVAQTPTPTGLRDSNGPAVASLLAQRSWINVVSVERVRDQKSELAAALRQAMQSADCVITTGGVSMGDHDHVPDVVESLGGREVFHRIAIKPGKPIFAATLPENRLFIGLPGNAVSALVTARRIALPALAAIAGAPSQCVGPDARVTIADDGHDMGTNSRTRFLLVERVGPDQVRLLKHKGSGDLPAAANSDGFVEIPQGSEGVGPFDYYAWSDT